MLKEFRCLKVGQLVLFNNDSWRVSNIDDISIDIRNSRVTRRFDANI